MTKLDEFATEEEAQDEAPTTASKFNGRIIWFVGVMGFLAISIFVMVWSMRTQNQRMQPPVEKAKPKAQISAKQAEEEAKQRAEHAKKKAKKALPQPSIRQTTQTPDVTLNTRFAPQTAPQPIQRPVTPQGTQPINPWKQARDAYIAQKAQNFYQMRAQALTAPMQSFGPSGFTAQPTQSKAQAKPDDEAQAFLAKLQRIKTQGTQMANVFAKPGQQLKPQVMPSRHQERFMGQPLGHPRNQGPVDVATGTIVSVILETGLDSQLPGMIFGIVASPVYDPTMTRIVIPSGSRLVGQYNNRVQPGQTRAQVRWSRLVLPDGHSVILPNLPGVDFAGYSGIEGQVNEHWGRIALGAVVSATFSSAAAVFGGPTNQFNVQPQQQALYGALNPVSKTGQAIAKRFLDVEPTLTVKAGALVGMLVTQDLVIKRSGGQ